MERRLEVCRVLHYESQPEGHTVCQQGDVGTSFYIVLTGKVSILIKQQEAQTRELMGGLDFDD